MNTPAPWWKQRVDKLEKLLQSANLDPQEYDQSKVTYQNLKNYMEVKTGHPIATVNHPKSFRPYLGVNLGNGLTNPFNPANNPANLHPTKSPVRDVPRKPIWLTTAKAADDLPSNTLLSDEDITPSLVKVVLDAINTYRAKKQDQEKVINCVNYSDFSKYAVSHVFDTSMLSELTNTDRTFSLYLDSTADNTNTHDDSNTNDSGNGCQKCGPCRNSSISQDTNDITLTKAGDSEITGTYDAFLNTTSESQIKVAGRNDIRCCAFKHRFCPPKSNGEVVQTARVAQECESTLKELTQKSLNNIKQEIVTLEQLIRNSLK